MLKSLTMFTVLVVLEVNGANAQQREAIFQKIEVPNASFDIVIAMAKPNSPELNFRGQPDPIVVYLPNGLLTAYTPELAKMLDIETLKNPAHAPAAEHEVIYFVPKRAIPTAATR